MIPFLAWLLLLAPLLSAAAIHLYFRKNQTLSSLISTGSAALGFVSALILLPMDTGSVRFDWITIPGWNSQIQIGLELDKLAKGMMLVVTGVGVLVHIFSLAYMEKDESKARYFCGLSLFMFSMTGIVLATNFIMMFIFWELVGLSSYLLIGHWFQKDSAADAAKKAFLTNRIGDFGFMIGILMLWGIAGTFDFAGLAPGLAENTHSATLLGIAVLCIFAGAIGKSAQAPLHVWLPDAMEGPTPVSALIHAATMVAAGVYMMARLFISLTPDFAELATLLPTFSYTTIAWVGGITALLAALMATQQDDIKKVLAYSTLSQLGYMVMAVGLLKPEAGMFHLFTHAWFKALLFLGSGAVIYACHHQQNIWKMGGLRKTMPITTITFLIGTAALAGFPIITAGFWSKEQVLEAAFYGNNMPLFIIATAVACLTTFYMLRLFFVAFLGKHRSDDAKNSKEVGPLMKIPLIILAVLAVIAGFKPIAETIAPLFEYHEINLRSPALWASIGSILVGAAAAALLYLRSDKDPLENNPVAKLFRNKFYIDEGYAKVVKFGQDAVAAFIHFFDELFIGGLFAGGLARSASGVGKLFTRLQSGNLHGYSLIFGVGVLLLIYLTVFAS